MSEYVKFRKVENVELSYTGATYLSMRTGDTLNTPKTDFRDGMIGLIKVSCKITKLDGTIVDIVNENAFDFNNDYGDVIRYKDSEDNIKSFYDGEKLTEIRVDGNYLKITPVLVCEFLDKGLGIKKLIAPSGQSTPLAYYDVPRALNKPLAYGDIGKTIQYNLLDFRDGYGYTNADPHYFIYRQKMSGSNYNFYLVKTHEKDFDKADAFIEQGIFSNSPTGFPYGYQFYEGQFDYNGTLYDFVGDVSGGYTMSVSTGTTQVYTSLNDIFIRVDGVLRAEIRTDYSLTNPMSIEDRLEPINITVKVIYTDNQERTLNYSLGEYTLISGVNHLIFDGNSPSSSGIFFVQASVGEYYDGSGDKTIASNVSEIPVMELDAHAIELFTYKPIYYFGERFDRIVVSCYALYKITESINYRALIGGSSYSLNVANGTQLFRNTLLVATLVNSEYGTLTSELTLLVEVDTRQELLVYDKLTNAEKNFGGIDMSSGFNIGFNLDGTLDSCSVQVFNGEDYALETNTLCMLTFNRSWWVVKSDKKEYINSETTNKYKHTIELLDPRHLLKSRSLVSCGFNKDRYTYQSFLDRLISLSNFNNASVSLGNVFNANNKVSVIKSFDNYTLGKALEEFANSENAIHKVDYIDKNSPYIYFLSKSGNNETIIDLDSDVKHKIASYVNEEIGNKDFASKVISNIENAISSVPQRYPLTGGKFLDADEFELTKDNAYFKMPSKAFKVNKLIVQPRIKLTTMKKIDNDNQQEKSTKPFYFYDKDQLIWWLEGLMSGVSSIWGINQIADDLIEVMRRSFELEIDKQQKQLTNPNEDVNVMFISESLAGKYDKQDWYFKFKEGDNKITNFKCLDRGVNPTEGTRPVLKTGHFFVADPHGTDVHLTISETPLIVLKMTTEWLTPKITKFAVEYIPQSDMEMSYENGTKTKDITLFNQTGNFIDNFAVSKLVKSYATDISGNTHNYYSYYENYFDILEVGRKVYKVINGKQELMVISNVSIDVINGSKYAVMYSLSKHSAVKSLMISADSNIRDYETPQRNNVKRKQNYKDYIELTFGTATQDLETPYATLNAIKNLFALEVKRKGAQVDYVAFIGINKEETNKKSFYQIPTYAIYYDSSASVVADFGDNNIIGYDKSNTGSVMEWSITKWNSFFSIENRYNVPIDYTASSGNFGELKDIEVIFANKTTIDVAFIEYKGKPQYGLSNLDDEYNITEVAPLSFEGYHNTLATMPFVRPDIVLREQNYNKDGLEVPFFQYTIQIGNTEDIRVGSNILVNHGTRVSEVYVYQFHFRDDARPDNYNFRNVEPHDIGDGPFGFITLKNACVITTNPATREMQIKFYSTATFNLTDGSISDARNYELDGTIENKCIEIVSARCNKGEMSESELIFAIDNCPTELNNESILRININIYKK